MFIHLDILERDYFGLAYVEENVTVSLLTVKYTDLCLHAHTHTHTVTHTHTHTVTHSHSHTYTYAHTHHVHKADSYYILHGTHCSLTEVHTSYRNWVFVNVHIVKVQMEYLFLRFSDIRAEQVT